MFFLYLVKNNTLMNKRQFDVFYFNFKDIMTSIIKKNPVK
jgi:hypothetical protein